MEGNIDKKIQSLQEWTKTDYEVPKDKTEEYIKRLIKNEEAYLYLVRERNLSIDTIEHFKLGLSSKNELTIPIYKDEKLIDYKFRTLPPEEKGFRRISNTQTWVFNGDEGFKEGKEKGEIIIVEGEIDCISVWQAGFKNVISLVGGANNIGPWVKELDDLKTIYVNLDSDEPGKKAARVLADRIGTEKCIEIILPEKDPNDFFKKYKSEDYKNVLSNSEKFRMEDVAKLSDLYKEVKETPIYVNDFEYPFESLQNLSGGFSRSNIIVVSAPTSMGKSSFTWNILARLAEKNTPIMYIPLEDNIQFFGRRIFNIIGNRPTWQFSDTEWGDLKKKLVNFPFFVYTGFDKFNLDVLRKLIERGKKLYGIEIFAIDHLHFLISRASDTTQEISHIMREITSLAREKNIVIILLVQIRKKKEGEEGWKKMPNLESLSDSVKISQDAHQVIMLFQDYAGDNPYLQVMLQKNRQGAKHLTREDSFNYNIDLTTSIIKDDFYKNENN